MKKFTKLLGAFALGALATFSASAAVNELPAYVGSCSPAVGVTVAPENISELGGMIYVYPATGQKFGVWVDPTGYDYGVTDDNVVEITKPDNTTVSSKITAHNTALSASVPENTWGQEGIYTITVKANGIKLLSGATATDFSYQVGIGNDITIGGGGSDDTSIPQGWTVTPTPETEGIISTFGGVFSLVAPYYLNTYDNSTYTYKFPGGGKDVIEVKFPDGQILTYSVQTSRQFEVQFTVPNSEFQKHGTGTCTVTAKFAGLKADSGDDLKDFSWNYQIIEAPTVNLDDILDLPAGASIYTNIDDAFYDRPIAEDHILKSLGNFYIKIPGSVYSIAKVNTTDASVTLYKKGADGYSEVNVAKNVRETTDDNISTFANRVIDFYFRPQITDPGDYALVIDLPNTKYGSPSAAMPKLKFFVTIPSKPDPVAAVYEITPADGTHDVTAMPAEIKVTFTNAANMTSTSGLNGIVTVTDPAGNAVTVSTPQISGNAIVFSVADGTWSKNGEYRLSLDPSGVVKGSAENEADLIFSNIAWKYNVIGNVEPLPENITITPTPGNVDLAAFADGIKVAFAVTGYYATMGHGNVAISCNGKEYKNAAAQTDAFFKFNDINITEPGKYVFEFKGNGAKWVTSSMEQTTVPDFSFIYEVLPGAPEPPTITIPDAEVDFESGYVEVQPGSKITLTAGQGEKIYYMWAPEAVPLVLKVQEGFTEYTEPIEAQTGTFVYYAEGPGGESEYTFIYVNVLEPPTITIPGVEVNIDDGYVEVPAGSKITLTAGRGSKIYYMWQPAAQPAVLKVQPGFTEYTEPIEAQTGTLVWYAEGPKGGESSAVGIYINVLTTGAPEPPTITIPGVEIDLDYGQVEVPAGSKITLTAGPDEKIYYMWQTAGPIAPLVLKVQEGFTEYTEPIEAQTGNLVYYAEGPGGKSAPTSIYVTVLGFEPETLPTGVTVTPEQAEYTTDQVATLFANGVTVDLSDVQATMNAINVRLVVDGTTELPTTSELTGTHMMGGTFKFAVTPEMMTEGLHTLEFKLNGAMANSYTDFSFKYNIVAPDVPESNIPEGVTVNPKEGIQAPAAFTGTISVTPKNSKEGAIMNAGTATLTVNGTTYPATQGDYIMTGTESYTFAVPASVFAEDGYYTCVFNPGTSAVGMGTIVVPSEFQFVYKVDHTVGVAEIVIENGDSQFFTLEGIKVQNPEQGRIYIKIVDGKASKVLIK